MTGLHFECLLGLLKSCSIQFIGIYVSVYLVSSLFSLLSDELKSFDVLSFLNCNNQNSFTIVNEF